MNPRSVRRILEPLALFGLCVGALQFICGLELMRTKSPLSFFDILPLNILIGFIFFAVLTIEDQRW